MELGERKKKILAAIIDDYIKTAEPVGSRTISKNHGLSISSATIRNEMADLEEMGFLDKPHTSAGRMPSSLGYRFYVDSLMQKYEMTLDEMQSLKGMMESRIREMDELVAQATEIVSGLTNYAVIATLPSSTSAVVKSVRLLPIGEKQIIIALVTSAGDVKNTGITVPAGVSDEYVYAASQKLAECLTGKTPYDLGAEEIEELQRCTSACPGLINGIFEFLYRVFDKDKKKAVYTGGVVNIFNHPEYKDLDKARDFISFIGSRDNVNSIFSEITDDEHIKVKIGDENSREELKDCSIVVSNYDVGGKLKGNIGIIGPKRMDYAKVISYLNAVSDKLNVILYKMFFDEE